MDQLNNVNNCDTMIMYYSRKVNYDKGSFNNYVTLNLPVFCTYLPYVTLCHKLKGTYHRCYVTLRIVLTM